MNLEEKQYYSEIEKSLKSKDKKIVRTKIMQIKTKGNANLLPFVLNLLKSGTDEDVKNDILEMLSDLKEQACAPVIADFIHNNPSNSIINEVLASCWQSGLDYSDHLDIFACCFISGTYQTALESFTVIEEMAGKSTKTAVLNCRKLFLSRMAEISAEKKPLLHELLLILEKRPDVNMED
jgi:hypothetical protein